MPPVEQLALLCCRGEDVRLLVGWRGALDGVVDGEDAVADLRRGEHRRRAGGLDDRVDDGLVEKEGRSRYRVTKEGVDWVFQSASDVRRFVDHVTDDVLGSVQEDAAIAVEAVEAGWSAVDREEPRLLQRGPDFTAYRVIDVIVDAYFDVLDEIAVRRTRHFVKRYYPNETIPVDGEEVTITFPEPSVRSVEYEFGELLPNFFEEFAEALDYDPEEDNEGQEEGLTLARYMPSQYNEEEGPETYEVQVAELDLPERPQRVRIRQLDETTAEEAVRAIHDFEGIESMPLVDEIAAYAADLRAEYYAPGERELSYADAIHLATAVVHDDCDVLYSGDPDFEEIDAIETVVLS